MNVTIKFIAFLSFALFAFGCGGAETQPADKGNSNDGETASSSNTGSEDSSPATEPAGEKNNALVNLKLDESESNYLSMRDAPDSKTGKLVKKLPPGAVVSLTKCQKDETEAGGKKGRWCEVKYEDTTGWAFDAFLVRFEKLNFEVTGSSAGDLKLGMTVAEAKKAAPMYKFSRTEDGEGISLIAAKIGELEVMTIYAGESDDGPKPKDDAKIEQITVWNPNFKTSKGVHPNMKLDDAAKSYGGIKEIMISEIESREWITFNEMPSGLEFRMYGGEYPDGQTKTTKYKSGTTIHGIVVVGSR